MYRKFRLRHPQTTGNPNMDYFITLEREGRTDLPRARNQATRIEDFRKYLRHQAGLEITATRTEAENQKVMADVVRSNTTAWGALPLAAGVLNPGTVKNDRVQVTEGQCISSQCIFA